MMRKKVIKYSSAGLIFVSLLLVFTIFSVSALDGIVSAEYIFYYDIEPTNFHFKTNLIPDIMYDISNKVNTDYRALNYRGIDGYNFLEMRYFIGDLYREEGMFPLDPNLPSSGEISFTSYSRIPIDVSETIVNTGLDFSENVPVEVVYYIYCYSTDGSIGYDRSEFFPSSGHLVPTTMSYVGSLYDSSTHYVLNMYKCTARLNLWDFDDGAVYWLIRNWASGSNISITETTQFVEGLSLFSGINIVKADEETTTPTIPDRPGPEIIGDQDNKLDQMKDHFEQPAPDLNDAIQNIDPNQMHEISGFFKSDSRFYVFMTALMVVGVSFGLIGYVLHGKRG